MEYINGIYKQHAFFTKTKDAKLQIHSIIFLMKFEYWYIKIMLDIGSLIMNI